MNEQKNNRTELFRQITLFVFVGGVGSLVDFFVYFVLASVFHVYYLVASIVSVSLAIVWTFIGNSFLTFSRTRERSAKQTRAQAVKFLTASLYSLILQNSLLFIFVQYVPFEKLFGSSEKFFAKALAIAIVAANNFFVNKFWVFAKKKNPIE